MLKYGNREIRNLQEQVAKNMDDIAYILNSGDGSFINYGLKIVYDLLELPTVAEYKEENPNWSYGDAVIVDDKAYVLVKGYGEEEDSWKDLGEFPVAGPQGPQGIQGERGPQGIQGIQGPKGDKGDRGPEGPIGEKGPKGDQGIQGPIGPEGPEGPEGPQGPKGDTGAQGPKGETGATGPQGPQGIQGPKGDTGTFNSVTAEVGANIGTPTVTVTYSDGDVDFAFDGLKGEKGDKGDKGDTGATGPQGETGPQGPQGAPGDVSSNIDRSVSPIYLNNNVLDVTLYRDYTNYEDNGPINLEKKVLASGTTVSLNANLAYDKSRLAIQQVPHQISTVRDVELSTVIDGGLVESIGNILTTASHDFRNYGLSYYLYAPILINPNYCIDLYKQLSKFKEYMQYLYQNYSGRAYSVNSLYFTFFTDNCHAYVYNDEQQKFIEIAHNSDSSGLRVINLSESPAGARGNVQISIKYNNTTGLLALDSTNSSCSWGGQDITFIDNGSDDSFVLTFPIARKNSSSTLNYYIDDLEIDLEEFDKYWNWDTAKTLMRDTNTNIVSDLISLKPMSAEFIPIDNNTIVNDNGVIKATATSTEYSAGTAINIAGTTISVKVDGTTIGVNANGELEVIGSIGGFSVASNISHANAVASKGVIFEAPDTTSVIITPESGYQIPTDITVTGASWNKQHYLETGEIILSNPTDDVTITGSAIADNCLTLCNVASTSSDTFTLKTANATANWNGTMEYSTDNSIWNTWDGTSITSGYVDGMSYIYLRGTNNSVISTDSTQRFVIESSIDPLQDIYIYCYGNIYNLSNYSSAIACQMTSLFSSTPIKVAPNIPALNTTLPDSVFNNLFNTCIYLVKAPNALIGNKVPSLPELSVPAYGYQGMFQNCCALEIGPELPATTISLSSYQSMFDSSGVRRLGNAHSLPATNCTVSCYKEMFKNCSNLTDAPTISATSLSENCFNGMFRDSKSFVNAPTLPVMTLENSCYMNMFKTCISLKKAPALPATTLADNCYESMFSECTSLVSIPSNLPATSLPDSCYRTMFGGCTSITTAPSISATTVANNSCASMFNGCTSLVTAPPALLAETLAISCYSTMFQGCTSLVLPPVLYATTAASSCSYRMFYNCTSLEGINALYPARLQPTCYRNMYDGCSKIKMSNTQTDDYQTEYRIPKTGTGTTATNALVGMFANTGGTFKGTPTINAVYYTANTVVDIPEPQPPTAG